jgi:ammonium transporter Rh
MRLPKFDQEALKFGLLALTFQFSLIILYAFVADYDPQMFPSDSRFLDEDPQKFYHYFQDVHVMMFVGFGFLLVFPYLYSWSAVVFNFMMGAFVLQWSILCMGFWHKVEIGNFTEKIAVDMHAYA